MLPDILGPTRGIGLGKERLVRRHRICDAAAFEPDFRDIHAHPEQGEVAVGSAELGVVAGDHREAEEQDVGRVDYAVTRLIVARGRPTGGSGRPFGPTGIEVGRCRRVASIVQTDCLRAADRSKVESPLNLSPYFR